MTRRILVAGAGVAGLSAALAAAESDARVTLLTPGSSLAHTECNTALAQGGIAASIGSGDDPSQHAADTIAAGAGLVDPEAAQVLTVEGRREMQRLIAQGFAVDRDSSGRPILGLEGAHRRPRIVHAGEDRTGASLHAYLSGVVAQQAARSALQDARIEVRAECALVRLATIDGAIVGAVVREGGREVQLSADTVVLATGGYAGLFPRSTNAPGTTGEGILLAADVGAVLADLEFVQFHPTVLAGTGVLISEAVRGSGAVLRDESGARFMPPAHPQAELAPRDVVSREITRVLRESGGDHVWLDASGIEAQEPGSLARRFPSITAALLAHDIDWTRDAVPVAPAAHYSMGGILTDLTGRTTVPGLYAAGEAAATGVHGANRLASNSLLEGLVFGRRAGRAAAAPNARRDWNSAAALSRIGDELIVALNDADARTGDEPSRGNDRSTGNGRLTALIAAAADARTESRGAHQRDDFPEPRASQAVRRGIRLATPANPDHAPAVPQPAEPELFEPFEKVTHPC